MSAIPQSASKGSHCQRRLGTPRSGVVCAATAGGLVAAVVLLATALTAPAQAHHRPGHDPSPSSSPSPSPRPSASPSASPSAQPADTVLNAEGERCIYYGGQWSVIVSGRLEKASGGGVPGAAVIVTTSPASETGTAKTNSEGDFWVVVGGPDLLFVTDRRLAWVAEFRGDAAHNDSTDSGVFSLDRDCPLRM